jgi:hypothetical protein
MLIAAIFLGSACGDDSAGVTSIGGGTETSTGTGTATATDGPVTLTTSVSLDDTGRTESSVTDPDTTIGTDPDTDSDTTTGPTTDTDSVTDTDAETGTDTGEEPALPGQTVSQLVTGGTQSASANYSAVFTIGQPSKLQSTHDSANYRLQGGLVGANGSPP